MQIRRIEIRDFRKLSHVVVEDIQDGLNVLVGDNEAGKSTLLAALRACLFERYRVGGEVAASMQPYGQSVRPEVSIEFDLEGKRWQLRKAFCQRPEAELVGPGERATGDAVDERLAELFGFTPPGRGRSKPEEHQGIYGLLWVEQGSSYRSLGVGAGHGSIASALEMEVGQVVGGERGRILLSAAEERRNAFWDRRGNPRGDYKKLADEIKGLEEQHSVVTSELDAYDAKIALLETKADALGRHAREDRLNKAVQATTAAKAAMQRLEQLDSTLRAAQDHLERCRLALDAAADKKKNRAALIASNTQTDTDLVADRARAKEARQLLATHEASAKTAEGKLSEARERRKSADALVRALEQALAHRQAAGSLKRLEDQLTAAEEAEAKRRSLLSRANEVAIRQADISALEDLQAAHDRARLQLEAASVEINFKPNGQERILVDGEPHDAASALRLSRDAALELQGFGRLTIRPGGGVDTLRLATEATERNLADRLTELGCENIAAARGAVARRDAAIQEAVGLETTIAALAPEGMDTLRQTVDSQRNLVDRPLSDRAAALTDVSEAKLEEAVRAQEAASSSEDDAEAAAQSARRLLEDTGRQVAILEERAAATLRRHEAVTQELAAARLNDTDDQLEQSVKLAETAVEQAQNAHAEAGSALAAAEPEAAVLELQRAENAEKSIRSDIETLTREKRDLEIELKTLGRDGLGEQLAEIEGQLAEKTARLSTQHTEAAAARLLHETLAQAQRETKDRWLGPIRERVRPYLNLIQPEGEVVLNDETLEIEHFVRKGVREPFHSLSVGAREQVAVITRLALAELLHEAGQPSVVILDDALVNTDEGRLERMHLVLHKAAQLLQILVLTCRERDFMQLGAPVRRI